MPATNDQKKHSWLVRWIMVITLGCSLGLLFVFAVLSTRHFPRGHEEFETYQIIEQQPESPLKLSEERVEHELTRVIDSQLAAFRKDDYPQAYAYAATPLKTQLSLPAFERMVKIGYPLIAHSDSAYFGAALDNGETGVVNVTITGASGQMRHYQYFLQRERAGWKIFGVSEIKSPGTII